MESTANTMTSDEKTTETPPEAEAPTVKVADEDTAVPSGAAEPALGGDVEPAGEEPAGDVARLEAEKADLTDRLLRVAADLDNFRRRSERELADARKYAVQKFAADMLVVADNLRRALEAMPVDARQSGDDAFRALLEGVEVTSREMDRLLEKNGVTRIAAAGERFDPNRHEAMFEVPDASVPPGTVVQVVQEGYQLGDRVLRAALVGVSKEPPDEGAASGPAREAAAEMGESAG